MTDPWPDDMIRLLRERSPAPTSEPTATEAAAYVGMTTAEYGSFAILGLALLALWIMTS